MRRIALLTASLIFAGMGTVMAQTPRAGGAIRMTAPYGAAFASMDIHTTGRTQDGIWALAIHRQLYKWDTEKSAPVLELAKSVSVSPDGKVFTYKLRDDAYFHHGRKMTADDIIFSYNRVMDPKKGQPGARFVRFIQGAVEMEKGQATTISGLKKIDDFTLEITMKDKVEPGYLLFNMTTSILPADLADKPEYVQNPVGLGPFKFKEHIPGSRIVGEKWEKFYVPGKPYLDRFELVIMEDGSARDIAFRSKEIDTSILTPAPYVAYQADANLKNGILEVAELFTRNMGMNSTFKPFQDKRVRQAINHAIDTNLIVTRLVKNKAYRATGWLPLKSPAYDPTMKPYAFDPDKAKKLLAEAGYPDGFEFEWTTSQNESWGLPIVEAVIPMLAKVGIKVKTKLVEVTVLTDVVAKGEFQAYIGSSQTGPDPLATLRCFHSQTPRTACNSNMFSSPAYDKLIDAANAEENAAKQLEIIKQANAVLYDEAPVWFFNYNKAVLAFQPWIHGLQANATEITHQYPEDIWADANAPKR